MFKETHIEGGYIQGAILKGSSIQVGLHSRRIILEWRYLQGGLYPGKGRYSQEGSYSRNLLFNGNFMQEGLYKKGAILKGAYSQDG